MSDTFPYPVVLLMAAVFLWLTLGVAVSALRPFKRFGLRTLFIIITIAAVALSLGVILVRGS